VSRTDRVGLSLVVGIGVAAALFLVAFLRRGEAPPNGAPDDASPADASDPPRTRREPILDEVAAVESEALAGRVAAEWSELNDQAIAALEDGRLEEAVARFERCYQAEPGERVFAANLAEALARLARELYAADADLTVAIARLERAVGLASDREDLARLLERWKKVAAAEEDFWTDETEHFRLSYDGERTDLLHRGHYVLTNALESAYGEFGQTFGHYPVAGDGPKIKVVLYQRDEFTELTGIGHWSGGVYDGVVRIPVVDFDREKDELERVLRHELLHAFVRSVGGTEVPGWLNEGLAQWHEYTFLDERGARVERARKRLDGHSLFPLSQLHGSLARWTDEEKIARGYAQALALIAHIDRWYGERILYQMVEGCGQGRSCAETFQSRLQVTLDSVVKELEGSLSDR